LKASFIGAGRVGSTAAYTLMSRMKIDEIILVDVVRELAEGEALDLLHASYALDNPVKIYGGTDYSKLSGSDVVVISAGVARKPGMSRLDLLHRNAEIVKQISEKLRKYCEESVIVVVTNPVDLMTYILWRETGFPRERLIGMSGVLDTSRLKSIIGRATSGVVLGEHGDGMFIVGENKEFEEKVRKAAMEVIERKGATIFGPAASIYRLVKAVLTDSRDVLPASAVLDGEYGLKNVAIGVPTRIGKSGILEIIELEEAKKELAASASKLRKKLEEIGY